MAPEPTIRSREAARAALPYPLGVSGLRRFARGRDALVEGARRIGHVREGALLLPAYICRSVTDALNRAGRRYAYYPVTRLAAPRIDSLARLLDGGAGAVSGVVVVNYFGFPARIDRPAALCRERGAFLLEDNAHGFLGVDGEGRPLGSRGDLAIFSFAKTVYLPDGGALLVNHPRLGPGAGLGPARTRHGAFRLKRRAFRALGALGIDPVIVGRFRRGRGGAALGEPVEREAGGGMSTVARFLLEGIDPAVVVAYRRRHYREVVRICRGEGLEPLFEGLPHGVCPWIVPVVAPPGSARERAARALRRRGWKVDRWPSLPPDLEGSAAETARGLRERIMAVFIRPAVV